MYVVLVSEVGLVGGQVFGWQVVIQCYQFVILVLVQGLFQCQQCWFVLVQCYGVVGIGVYYVWGWVQCFWCGFLLCGQCIDVGCFQQCLCGQLCFQFVVCVGWQYFVLVQCIQLVICFVGVVGLCQCFCMQLQVVWWQWLDCCYVQCVDCIDWQIVCQQLFGVQQCLQGGVIFVQVLQQCFFGGVVGLCLCVVYGGGQCYCVYFWVFGGVVQQFFCVLLLVMFVGLQVVDQVYLVLFVVVVVLGMEWCSDQVLQQLQYQYCDYCQQCYFWQVVVIVVVVVVQGYFVEVVKVIGVELLCGDYVDGYGQ